MNISINKDVKINHYNGINNTPACIYALKTLVQLMEDGLSDHTLGLEWTDQAITASLDGAIVGVLIWQKQDWIKQIFIKIGYISPGFRKRGIYSILWKELLKKAKEEKIVVVVGATAIENKNMREIAKAQGREEYAVSMRYFIKEDTL